RARKPATAEVSVATDEMSSVGGEKREQLLGKDGSQVQRSHPGVTFFYARHVPGRPVHLRVAVVVDRRLDGDFAMQWRSLAHYLEPLATRAGQQPKVGVEDIESQDAVRLEMASHRGKEGCK